MSNLGVYMFIKAINCIFLIACALLVAYFFTKGVIFIEICLLIIFIGESAAMSKATALLFKD